MDGNLKEFILIALRGHDNSYDSYNVIAPQK